jgi:rare lipoprotein A
MRGCGDGGWDCRLARIGAIAVLGVVLASCASSDKIAAKVDPKYGTTLNPRVVEAGQKVPKGGGVYRVGKPYVVAGRTYVPEENANYRSEGLASWYGGKFHGRLTANGEVFDQNSISAAHPTLPMPSYVRVTNLANRRSIVVRVNDRGPYRGDRVIDLSVKTAHVLGYHGNGVARVRVEYLGSAPLEGSDDRMLLATLRHGSPAPAPSVVMVASAKPFVPEASERWRAAAGGPSPVPPDRPFTLGETASASDIAAARTRALTAVRRIEQAHAATSETTGTIQTAGFAPAAGWAPATSAYLPIRNDGTTGFMAGRGLY